MNSKGSKNARENRGVASIMKCPVCGDERKPIRIMSVSKNVMGYECKCGLLTKSRAPIGL
ncbi:MAG: hypothetical protein LBH98_06550 [Chitinispirillales bacterium]|jgi:predicted RNA-binding Zn-ribbon protein involved in translation (DUF1610 family)|nr:hypothetical protein [Chitinispirillales bacterium]